MNLSKSVVRHDARDMVYAHYLSQQCTEIARLYRYTESIFLSDTADLAETCHKAFREQSKHTD